MKARLLSIRMDMKCMIHSAVTKLLATVFALVTFAGIVNATSFRLNDYRPYFSVDHSAVSTHRPFSMDTNQLSQSLPPGIGVSIWALDTSSNPVKISTAVIDAFGDITINGSALAEIQLSTSVLLAAHAPIQFQLTWETSLGRVIDTNNCSIEGRLSSCATKDLFWTGEVKSCDQHPDDFCLDDVARPFDIGVSSPSDVSDGHTPSYASALLHIYTEDVWMKNQPYINYTSIDQLYLDVSTSVSGSFSWPTKLLKLSTIDAQTREIVYHEYAHALMDSVNYIEGAGGDHYFTEESSTTTLAFSEGFAQFMAVAVSTNPVYFKSLGLNSLEEDVLWAGVSHPDPDATPSFTRKGEYIEGVIAGIFLDIYDSGSEDSIDSQFQKMWNIVRLIKPKNFRQFYNAWMSGSVAAEQQAFRSVVEQNGIVYSRAKVYEILADARDPSSKLSLTDQSIFSPKTSTVSVVMSLLSKEELHVDAVEDVSKVYALLCESGISASKYSAALRSSDMGYVYDAVRKILETGGDTQKCDVIEGKKRTDGKYEAELTLGKLNEDHIYFLAAKVVAKDEIYDTFQPRWLVNPISNEISHFIGQKTVVGLAPVAPAPEVFIGHNGNPERQYRGYWSKFIGNPKNRPNGDGILNDELPVLVQDSNSCIASLEISEYRPYADLTWRNVYTSNFDACINNSTDAVVGTRFGVSLFADQGYYKVRAKNGCGAVTEVLVRVTYAPTLSFEKVNEAQNSYVAYSSSPWGIAKMFTLKGEGLDQSAPPLDYAANLADESKYPPVGAVCYGRGGNDYLRCTWNELEDNITYYTFAIESVGDGEASYPTMAPQANALFYRASIINGSREVVSGHWGGGWFGYRSWGTMSSMEAQIKGQGPTMYVGFYYLASEIEKNAYSLDSLPVINSSVLSYSMLQKEIPESEDLNSYFGFAGASPQYYALPYREYLTVYSSSSTVFPQSEVVLSYQVDASMSDEQIAGIKIMHRPLDSSQWSALTVRTDKHSDGVVVASATITQLGSFGLLVPVPSTQTYIVNSTATLYGEPAAQLTSYLDALTLTELTDGEAASYNSIPSGMAARIGKVFSISGSTTSFVPPARLAIQYDPQIIESLDLSDVSLAMFYSTGPGTGWIQVSSQKNAYMDHYVAGETFWAAPAFAIFGAIPSRSEKFSSSISYSGEANECEGKTCIQAGTRIILNTGNDNSTYYAVNPSTAVINVGFSEANQDAFQRYSGPISLEQGRYLLGFASIKNDGNRELLNLKRIVVDGSVPQTEASISGSSLQREGITFISSSAVLSLSASDFESSEGSSGLKRTHFVVTENPSTILGWDCFDVPQVSSAPYGSCQNSLYVSTIALPAGTYSVFYAAEDNAGNREEVHRIMIAHDDLPPVSRFDFYGGYYEDNSENTVILPAETAVSIFGIDQPSGINAAVREVEYLVDIPTSSCLSFEPNISTATYGTCENRLFVSTFTLGEGTHEVSIRAVDNFGNYEDWHSKTLVVDATPPVLDFFLAESTITLQNEDIMVAGSSVSINAADVMSGGVMSGLGEGLLVLLDNTFESCGWGEDGPTEIDYAYPQGSCNNPEYQHPFTLEPGTHTIFAGAWDLADNLTTKQISLRMRPGAIKLYSIEPSSGPIGTSVTLIGGGFGSDTDTSVRLNFSTIAASVMPFGDTIMKTIVPGLDSGTYSLFAERISSTGTVSSSDAFSFTVVNPTIPVPISWSLPAGTSFMLSGSNLGAYNSEYTQVLIGGVAAPITHWDSESIQGTIPDNAALGSNLVSVRYSAPDSGSVLVNAGVCTIIPATHLVPSIKSVTSGKLSVAWNNIPQADYIVVLSTMSDYSTFVSSAVVSASSFVSTGLSPDTTYYFEVKLSTESDSSFGFNAVSAKTLGVPVIGSILLDYGHDNQNVDRVIVSGANFSEDDVIRLSREGQSDIIPSELTILSSTQIQCGLPISGVSVGTWNFVLSNTAGVSSAPFTVFESTPPITNLSLANAYTAAVGDVYVSPKDSYVRLVSTDMASAIFQTYYAIHVSTSHVEAELSAATTSQFNVYSDTFSLVLADGMHSLVYGSADLAHNYEMLHSTIVYVDGTSPTAVISASGIELSTDVITTLIYGASITINAVDPVVGNVTSGLSGVFYLVDKVESDCNFSEGFEPDSNSLPGTCENPVYSESFVLGIGTHTISAIATDNVGNTNTKMVRVSVIPATPLNLHVTADSASSVTVGWNGSSVTSYTVAISTMDSYGPILWSVKLPSTSFTFSSLEAATTYYFEVKVSTESDSAYLFNRVSTMTLETAPVILSVVSTGTIGMPITVSGTGFGVYDSDSSHILLSTIAATVSSWTATSISAFVPGALPPGIYPLIVEVARNGGIVHSSSVTFSVVSPQISTITPSVVYLSSAEFSITGEHFGPQSVGATWILIGDATAQVSAWTDTMLSGIIPDNLIAGSYPVVVKRTADGYSVMSDSATLNVVLPHISTMAPSMGGIGDGFTITGTGFGTYDSTQINGVTATRVLFGNVEATLSEWSDTEIRGVVPDGLSDGMYSVSVVRTQTDGSANSNGLSFVISSQRDGTTQLTSYKSLENYPKTQVKAGLPLAAGYGGKIEAWNHTLISVGKDAFPSTTLVTVNAAFPADDAEKEDRAIALYYARMAPAGVATEFKSQSPIGSGTGEIELPYETFALPPGKGAMDLALYQWLPAVKKWELVQSEYNSAKKRLKATIDTLGIYQVMVNGVLYQVADPTFRLGEVYAFPNPAKGGAKPTIHVEVGIADRVDFRIYDVAGDLRHTGAIEGLPQVVNDGQGLQYAYEYTWSGAGTGVYVCRIDAFKNGEGHIKATKKLAIIR